MKTRNRWKLVLLVLVVVACVAWFVASFTFTVNLSYAATTEVLLYGDQDVEQIFSAASATVHRLGYKTTNAGYSFSSDDMSGRILKAKHEDGIVVEINVEPQKDAPTRLRILLTEKRGRFWLDDLIDGTAPDDSMDAIDPLRKRVLRIREAITVRLESP